MYSNKYMLEKLHVVDFLFVVDSFWNYGMSNPSVSRIKWLEIMAWWCSMCVFTNSGLMFLAFVGSLFSIKHFQAEANGNILF